MDYENRTKIAKCGGLETNDPIERISCPDGLTAVRRVPREARRWRFQSVKTRPRTLVSEGLATDIGQAARIGLKNLVYNMLRVVPPGGPAGRSRWRSRLAVSGMITGQVRLETG
jgi:hypothetical protein